jgi:hypothetical protein
LRGVIGGIYSEPTESFAFPLMVYSNISEGENITFKYYNAERDRLYPCERTLTFYDDMIEANALNPFELHKLITEDEIVMKKVVLIKY